ncbi:hypothetical protein BD779DRAFT_1800508 [Infundibulicybe gibba]|nr:hypothetical protein BD779DRAFT_1800508 [Infundibulicybe gibba]
MQFYIDIPTTLAPREAQRQEFADFGYQAAQPITPRERYLTALAEAKAAEAEYLSAQAAALREEEVLERRLKQLRHQREQEAFHQTPYNFPAHRSLGIDAEISHHGLNTRRPTSRPQFLWGDARGTNRVQETTDPRWYHQYHSQPRESSRLKDAHAAYTGLNVFNGADTAQLRHDVGVFYNPFEQAILGPKQLPKKRSGCPVNKSIGPRCSPERSSPNTGRAPAAAPSRAVPEIPQGPVDLQAVIQAVLGATNESRNPQTHGLGNIQQAINTILGGVMPTNEAVEPREPSPASADSHKHAPAHDVTNLQDLFNAMFGFQPQPPAHVPRPEAQAQSSKSASIPSKAGDFQDVSSRTPQPMTSKQEPQTSPRPVVPVVAEKSVESSLRQELESRLNNEYATEVRDTIQALLASLAESPSAPSLPSSKPSGKGKEKAPEFTEGRPPTPHDVDHSMNDVRSIEATFAALESDFTFPHQLDFIAPAPAQDRPGSLVSDSGSSTSRLAFTARNHPVRFYEQALSALLVELDAIDSFGNESLRSKRKEVVGRVGHALEELEKEVEGRWRSRAAKEAKSPAGEAVQDLPGAAVSPQPTAVSIGAANTADAPARVTLAAAAIDTPSQASAQADAPESAEPIVQEPQSTTPHENPEEITIDNEPESTLTSASEATIRPYDLSSEPEEPVDTYLLPMAPSSPDEQPKQSLVEGDTGSEWSEVEA